MAKMADRLSKPIIHKKPAPPPPSSKRWEDVSDDFLGRMERDVRARNEACLSLCLGQCPDADESLQELEQKRKQMFEDVTRPVSFHPAPAAAPPEDYDKARVQPTRGSRLTERACVQVQSFLRRLKNDEERRKEAVRWWWPL
jgi:hypothetical protein